MPFCPFPAISDKIHLMTGKKCGEVNCGKTVKNENQLGQNHTDTLHTYPFIWSCMPFYPLTSGKIKSTSDCIELGIIGTQHSGIGSDGSAAAPTGSKFWSITGLLTEARFQAYLHYPTYYLPRGGQVYEPLPSSHPDTWLLRALALRYDYTDTIQSC